MRKFLALGLTALAAVAGSVTARAETLTLGAIYPAGNANVAPVSTITVEPFGGTDGAALSIMVEDRLRDVTVKGDPWFEVLPASLTTDADAVLRGSVATQVWREEADEQQREVCVERDEDRKCIRREERYVPCWDRIVSVQPTVRLIAYDGTLLHAEDTDARRSRRYCRTDRNPDEEAMVNEGLTEIAGRLRRDLAPTHVNESIRILESRKGMSKDDRNAFKDAIRLTKSDQPAACEAFVALEPTIGEHESLLFNIGLCNERYNRWDTAESYYQRALRVDGSNSAASSGLYRLRQYRIAQQQLEAHYAADTE